MNTGVQASSSSVNLKSEEQPEKFYVNEISGTAKAMLCPLAEDILPRELFETQSIKASSGLDATMEVDGFVQQKQQLQQQHVVESTMSRSVLHKSKSVISEENVVLQKLLRRWRYFDYRDESSRLEDHAVNSSAQKLGKPCYVCGHFQHTGKKCPKRRICCSCKKRGHIAEDCPKNNQEYDICLRCGESGHELFSCGNKYSPDDLKNIQCYICNELGHICCGNYIDTSPATVSCYNCGESGHSGLQCQKPHLDKCGSRPPSICYKCGEEGHIARKCVKDDGVSACYKHGQGGVVNLGEIADDVAVYQNRKKARRSKTYKRGRMKKQKMSELLEYMTL